MYSRCRNHVDSAAFCIAAFLLLWIGTASIALAKESDAAADADKSSARFCECDGTDKASESTSPAKTVARDKHRVLRVAADPNSLPFNNDRGEGFENKLAELLAREMHAELQYVWHAQRRGFFRETMDQGDCDLALGAPMGFERVLPTRPYYRSCYMFVTRKDRALKIESLDDPRLKSLKIGVQLIGDDGVNTPPAHALAARGIINNVVGYSVYGDYSQPNPPARIIEGVANGDVDVAIVWGPLAGYFAPRQKAKLELTPLTGKDRLSGMTFAFDIGAGIKTGNTKLRDEVNNILADREAEIDSILDRYGVPRLAMDRPEAVAKH